MDGAKVLLAASSRPASAPHHCLSRGAGARPAGRKGARSRACCCLLRDLNLCEIPSESACQASSPRDPTINVPEASGDGPVGGTGAGVPVQAPVLRSKGTSGAANTRQSTLRSTCRNLPTTCSFPRLLAGCGDACFDRTGAGWNETECHTVCLKNLPWWAKDSDVEKLASSFGARYRSIDRGAPLTVGTIFDLPA